MSSFLLIVLHVLLAIVLPQPNNIQGVISCGEQKSFTDQRSFNYDVPTLPTTTILFTTCNSGNSQNTRLYHWYFIDPSWQSDLCQNGGANTIGTCDYCGDNAARWTLILSSGAYFIEIEPWGSGEIILTMECDTTPSPTEIPSTVPITTIPTAATPTTLSSRTLSPTTLPPITLSPTSSQPTTILPTSLTPTTVSPITTTNVPSTVTTPTTFLIITQISSTHVSTVYSTLNTLLETTVSELLFTEYSSENEENDMTIVLILIIVIGVLGLLVVLLILFVIYMNKRKQNASTNSLNMATLTNVNDGVSQNNIKKDDDVIVNDEFNKDKYEDMYINKEKQTKYDNIDMNTMW